MGSVAIDVCLFISTPQDFHVIDSFVIDVCLFTSAPQTKKISLIVHCSADHMVSIIQSGSIVESSTSLHASSSGLPVLKARTAICFFDDLGLSFFFYKGIIMRVTSIIFIGIG